MRTQGGKSTKKSGRQTVSKSDLRLKDTAQAHVSRHLSFWSVLEQVSGTHKQREGSWLKGSDSWSKLVWSVQGLLSDSDVISGTSSQELEPPLCVFYISKFSTSPTFFFFLTYHETDEQVNSFEVFSLQKRKTYRAWISWAHYSQSWAEFRPWWVCDGSVSGLWLLQEALSTDSTGMPLHFVEINVFKFVCAQCHLLLLTMFCFSDQRWTEHKNNESVGVKDRKL